MLKKIIYTGCSLFFLHHMSFAQQLTPDYDKLNKLLKKNTTTPDINSFKVDGADDLIKSLLPVETLTFEYENDFGKVYTSRHDNMPILKPAQEGNIPTYKPEEPGSAMPNPLIDQPKKPVLVLTNPNNRQD